MRKILLGMSGMFFLTGLSAQIKVQGVPYRIDREKIGVEPRTQLAKAANEAGFTLDDIVNWSGSGANRGAVAVQWNNNLETEALVWGYCWDGKATGESMLRAIAKEDPRFFIMAEAGTGHGSTIAGLGYDANGDGLFSVVKDGVEYFPNEEGVIYVSGYGYDGFTPKDAEDYWQSGWYEGYWSYWVKDSAADNWGYSSLGATNRELETGNWDGWNFAVEMMARDWLPLAAAPASAPSAPSFGKHPQHIYADPGFSVSLSVSVRGTTPALQWYKNDVAIAGATGKTFSITEAKESDSGVYHCVATNDLGTAVSEKATVVIGEKAVVYAVRADQTAEVIADARYAGFIGTLDIPASVQIDGKAYAVSAIAQDAFAGCDQIISVALPSSLKTIGNSAFNGCASLVDVTFNAGMEQIGDSAFFGCSLLQQALLPNSLRSIGKRAFVGCDELAVLQLGDALESVGEEAFYDCRLVTELTIPKTLTTVGMKAFSNMRGVKKLVYLPETEVLPDYMFHYWSALTSIELPASVTKVGKYAFYYCSALQTVTAPGGIDAVGEYGFYNCSKLTGLTLKEGITSIGQYGFNGCSVLTGLSLPSTVETIGKYAFYNCKKLTEMVIPAGVTKLGDNTFYGAAALASIRFEGAITEFGNNVFQNCTALTSCALPDSLAKLGNSVFKGCSALQEVTFGSKLKNLGTSATGSNYTFENCKKLQKVVLGANLTAIGNYAFSNCTALKEIYYNSLATPAVPGSSAFKSVPTTCKVFVNAALEETFKSVNYWKALTIVGVEEPDYTKGFFVVNEDWFGHDYGTVNFVTDEHEMICRTFRKENPNENLGITTQYGTVYGDNFYFVSKQANTSGEAADKGGRLVVADAKTLKKKAAFETLNGGDGRSFLGVDAQTGYVGTSAGIVLFDIPTLSVGETIENTGGGSAYSGQIGNMVRVGDYVFALKQSTGILVIDAATHALKQTIAYPNASMMTLSKDGKVWVALSGQNKLVSIDPVSFEAKEVSCPSGVKVSSSWGAWNAGDLCASAQENTLYLATGGSFSLTTVVKYDIDADTFDPAFFILPDQDKNNGQILYGAGMRVDPLTDQLVITATQSGFGAHYQNNWIHLVNGKTGALVKTITPENYYWFPAVPVFTDRYLPEVTLPAEVKVQDEAVRIALNTLVSDKDHQDAAIRVSVQSEDEAIVSAAVVYPELVLEGMTTGNTNVELVVESNGKVVRSVLPVQVEVGTGLNDAASLTELSVYPNPATDQLFVKAPAGADIRICDLSGRLVVSRLQTVGMERFDLSDIPAGVYVVQLKNGADSRTLRFIKQ